MIVSAATMAVVETTNTMATYTKQAQ